MITFSAEVQETRAHLYLVAPAGEVSERLDGHAHVSLQGQSVHGSRIHGLDGGQLLLVLLHQVGHSERRQGDK